MSNALALAAVSAVIRDRLTDGLVRHNISGLIGSTVNVSVMPPDRVAPAGGAEPTQLNLFLHRVTPNVGLRNVGLPSRDASGRHRLGDPPLALDLHYILTAFGATDLHGEILLGCAAQLMHENPVLDQATIRSALANLPAGLAAVADCGLADQIEGIRVTPQVFDTEEMSKLWTGCQTHYRSTLPYLVTVVLIESARPGRAALPVLSRGERDGTTGRERGVIVSPGLIPPVPAIDDVTPAGEQPVARLGEAVVLTGHHLDGTGREVRLVNDRFGVDETLAASGASAGGLLEFVIPVARAADFPVGAYRVSARVIRPGETDPRETNRLGLVLAPEMTNLPLSEARDGGGTVSFSVAFRPEVRDGQSVSLLLGQTEIVPEVFVAPTGSVDFVIDDAPVGDHLARLRIDGIDSPLIDRAATPPEFYDFRIEIT